MDLDDPVWYVAYGSNLAQARFEAYLFGGSVVGARRTYPGCRDRTTWSEWRPVELDHELAFGRHSPTWDAGVAFVAPTVGARADRGTIGRAWRIRAGQFADLIAQENRGTPVVFDPAWGELEAGARADLGIAPRWYDTVVGLDPIDGEPALTVTGSVWPVDPALAPAPAYLACIRAGLEEMGFAPGEVADYVARHVRDAPSV